MIFFSGNATTHLHLEKKKYNMPLNLLDGGTARA